MTRIRVSPSGKVTVITETLYSYESCAEVRSHAASARSYSVIIVKNRGTFYRTLSSGSDTGTELTDYIATAPGGFALEQRAYGDYAYLGDPAYRAGRVYFDGNSWNCMTEIPGVIIQLGEENQIQVVNDESLTITNGQAVYASGAQGQRLATKLFANGTANAGRVLGLYTHDCAAHQNGRVTNYGLVHDLNTNGLTVGAPIFTSGTPGVLTQTKPLGTVEGVEIGLVVQAHPNQGTIFVRPQKLDRLVGTTATRPTSPRGGDYFVDTTLGRPIWWTGSVWIDATGASV